MPRQVRTIKPGQIWVRYEDRARTKLFYVIRYTYYKYDQEEQATQIEYEILHSPLQEWHHDIWPRDTDNINTWLAMALGMSQRWEFVGVYPPHEPVDTWELQIQFQENFEERKILGRS